MKALRLALPLFAVLIAGCADLQVRKVNPNDPCDDTKGFRYYLARPYVLVKDWTLVSEEISLVVLDTENAKKIFQGQASIKPAEMKRIVSTGELIPVSNEEWAVMKSQLESKVVPASFRGHQQPANVSQSVTVPVAGIPAGAEAYSDTSEVTEFSALSSATFATKTAGDEAPAPTPAKTADPPAKTVDLNGKIDVVFLPDMDEQYAVHNRNWLAKSTYTLNFKDGWQLASVNGEFDSTAVAVEVLNTIDSAIEAAKKVALAGSSPAATKLPSGSAFRAEAGKVGENGNLVVVEVVNQTYLKPGVYRVNKPWEIGDSHELMGCGLLMKMGLPTSMFTTVRPATPVAAPAIGAGALQ